MRQHTACKHQHTASKRCINLDSVGQASLWSAAACIGRSVCWRGHHVNTGWRRERQVMRPMLVGRRSAFCSVLRVSWEAGAAYILQKGATHGR